MKTSHKSAVQDAPKARIFPIVGIGASSGGLDALTSLLSQLSAEPGLSCVVVQHALAGHEGLSAGTLAGLTKLPVEEAADGKHVEKNRVYVVPPNATMSIRSGILRPARREPGMSHMPIDTFFSSLAEDQGGRAIGVVLSGTGLDGTHGVEAIRCAGGLTFAQEEAASKFAAMPPSAVDFVLPPARAAQELEQLARVPEPFWADPRADAAGPEGGADEEDLASVLAILRKHTGIDFRGYRLPTIRRRAVRRMAIHRMTVMKDYVALLMKEKSEAEALHQDILIKVTSFFREPETFECLAKRVIPAILARRRSDESVRVWVPGCCTGEEPYSIAMLFQEAMSEHGSFPVQIFATDICEKAIERARAGFYPATIDGEIPEARLRRFFTPHEGRYQISKTIRDMCVLARHDVIRDTLFSHIDLVSCRNLLIYLDPALQKKVLLTLHYALKPGGFLALGSAETLGAHAHMFTAYDKHVRVFARRDVAPPKPVSLDDRPERRLSSSRDSGGRRAARRTAEDVQRDVDRLVLAQFSPPGVVVSESLEVIQIRGPVAPYVTPAQGKASLSLLRMAHASLTRDLREVLQEAISTGNRVRSADIQMSEGADVREVAIEVFPIAPGAGGERTYLVLFELLRQSGAPGAAKKSPDTRRHEKLVDKLQQELAATRETLQMTIDEHESTCEAYKSANEEILSSNEKLQAATEGMEVAREELQSANEELATVNEELHSRNADLLRQGDDLANLVAGVNTPVLMIGMDGQIRRFTPSADRNFPDLSVDVGSALSAKPRVHVPDLDRIIQEVLASGTTVEREVQDAEGRWFRMTLRPYRTRDNRIDGAVLAFLDIDAWKKTAAALQASREFVEKLSDAVREPILFLDSTLRIVNANRALANFFQTTLPALTGRLVFDLFPGDIPALRDALLNTLTQGSSFENLSAQLDFAEAGRKTLTFRGAPVAGPGSGPPMVLLVFEAAPGT